MILPAVATGSISVIRFDADDEHKIATFAAHTSAITCVAVSASGRYVATGSTVGTLIRLWDVASRTEEAGVVQRQFTWRDLLARIQRR